MKLNISYPATGCQKVIDIEDEAKLRPFFEKRISHEVEGETLGEDFKGYVFKITGGNDKQGFAMLQGVLTANRVRLLFTNGMKCFRPRKRGERKRKSVRGCVVGSELSVLNLVVIKKGPQEIPGLTDIVKPRRLGPKRASRIRKLFNLTDKDDVRQYVIRRQIVPKVKEVPAGEDGEKVPEKPVIAPPKAKKPYQKAPKIQRLVTPQRLQRKRERKAIKKQRFEKSRKEAEEYNKLLAQRMKEKRAQREQKLAKKRSVSRAQSQSAGDAAKPAPAKAAAPAKPAAAEPKKAEPKKAEPKKAEPKKAEPKKAEPKKEDKSKKAEPKKEDKSKKAEPKKAEPKKEEPKKAAPAKEAPKAAAPKKEEPKKAEPKKEAKKEEPKKAEPKKAEPKAEQPKKDQAKKGGDKDQAKGKKK